MLLKGSKNNSTLYLISIGTCIPTVWCIGHIMRKIKVSLSDVFISYLVLPTCTNENRTKMIYLQVSQVLLDHQWVHVLLQVPVFKTKQKIT